MGLLTVREKEVLAALTLGWGNKQIAGHLGVRADTVSQYLARISEKLGISGRVALAVWAKEHVLPPSRFEAARALVSSGEFTPDERRELALLILGQQPRVA